MSREKSKNIEKIFDRLKFVEKIKTYKAIADALGVSTSRVFVWKKRNHIDFEVLYSYSKTKNLEFDWLLTGEGKMFREDQNQGANSEGANSEGAKGANFEGANATIWLSVANISALAQISKEAIQKAIKKGTWRGHQLVIREAYGNGGKRKEVLLSSLPSDLQQAYWQGKTSSKDDTKIRELAPVSPPLQPKQEPAKPLMNKAGGVCQACGQGYGLIAQIETLTALVGSKEVTIQDKVEMLQMKNEEIGRLKEEIKKQVEEIADLEQLAQEKMA